jgi:hypothetical protein
VELHEKAWFWGFYWHFIGTENHEYSTPRGGAHRLRERKKLSEIFFMVPMSANKSKTLNPVFG